MIQANTTAKHQGSVLVLGADARMVLPIARSLGRHGLAVHVGWCPRLSPACCSRYVRQIHDIPAYQPDDTEWLSALQKLLDDHRFELVIPATEPTVFALQRHRRDLEQLGRIYLIEDRTFAIAFDKTETGALAASLGIPLPKSSVVEDEADARRQLADAQFPIVVKPASSVSEDDPREKQFVVTFDDRDACQRFVESRLLDGVRLLIQEYCPGVGVGLEFIANDGKILNAFQHQRLHETSGHGSTYRMSVPADPLAYEATQKLVHALNYTGVGMCEFKVDDETGRWVFLELNARFWGSLPLAVTAGADFPWYLYQMLVHGTREFPDEPKVGVRARDMRSDLRWLWRTLTRSRSHDRWLNGQSEGFGLNEIPKRRLIGDLIRLITFRDRFDTFSLDDPRPAIRELCHVGRSVTKKMLGG